MGRTRRSGHTAGEALPLQLHTAGPHKGGRRVILSPPCPRGLPGHSRGPSCHQPRGWALRLRTGGVMWRQDAKEAAETQEAEAAQEARRVEDMHGLRK